MEITVTRTGGFAGVNEQLGPISVNELDPTLERELKDTVDRIGFFSLPEHLPPGRGSDFFYYEITIKAEQGEHSVSFDDGTDDAARAGVADLLRVLERAGFTFENRDRAA